MRHRGKGHGSWLRRRRPRPLRTLRPRPGRLRTHLLGPPRRRLRTRGLSRRPVRRRSPRPVVPRRNPEPVALAGERIPGETHAARTCRGAAVPEPLRPVHRPAARPERPGRPQPGGVRVAGTHRRAQVELALGPLTVREPGQQDGEFGTVRDDERDPRPHRVAADPERVRDVGERLCGLLPQMGEQGARDHAQPFRCPRREGHEMRARRVRRAHPVGEVLLQHDVRVRAAEPEGAHPGPAWRDTAVRPRGGRLPGPGLADDVERTVVEVDEPVLLAEVDGGGQRPVCQGDDHLGDPGDPGGPLQMSDVGLDRPDSAARRPGDGALRRVQVPEGGLEGHDLDRVADGRPRTVRLDVADGLRADSGAGVEPFDQVRLRGRTGDGQGAGPAAVVRGDPLDDRVDGIAVRDGPCEGFRRSTAPPSPRT